MNVHRESPALSAGTAAAAALARLRRGSLGALVLIVVEYGIGMYVNLYVAVPRADHGASLWSAISNGPGALSAHAVIGLLLGLAAIAVLVQAVIARHQGVIVSSAIGLFALAAADATGTTFTSNGHAGDSLWMSVLTGVALLCYGVNLFVVRPHGPRG